MDSKSFIAEKIFAIVIAVYLFLLFRYRWQILTSKSYIRKYQKYAGIKKNVIQWYQLLDKKKFFFNLFLATIVIFSGYGVYSRLNPEKRFHRLINGCPQLIKDGKDDQAIIDMTNALKIRPNYVKGHFFLANLYIRKKQINKAQAELFKIIHINPEYKNTLNLLESILMKKKDAGALKRLADHINAKMPVESNILMAESLILDNKLTRALALLQKAKKIAPGNERIYPVTGDLLVLMGQPREAINAYKKAISLKFGLWQVHFAMAKLYLKLGLIQDARSQLTVTRSLHPEFRQSQLLLAGLYAKNSEFDKAEGILKDFLKKNKDDGPASYQLADLYLKSGSFQEAVNLLNRIFARYQDKPEYLYDLALAYFNTGKYHKSKTYLDHIKRIRKLNIVELRLLARLQLTAGNKNDGIKTLQNMVKSGKADYKDINLLNRTVEQPEKITKKEKVIRSKYADLEVYLRDKDYDSLIKGALKAVSQNSFKAPFYNLLGVAYLATGDIQPAKKYFLLSYNDKKENPMPLINLVNLFMKTGKITEAEKLLNAHNLLFPDEPVTKLVLGKIYLATGRIDDAANVFKQVQKINPYGFEAYRQMGIIYRIKNDMKSSLDEYIKSIKRNPNDMISLNDIANIYATDEKNIEKALVYARRAANLAPDNATVADTLGWVYYLKGDFLKSLVHFKTAYEMNPYFPVFPYHLALTQFKLKRYDDAQQNLKLALNMKGRFEYSDKAKKLLKQITQIRRTDTIVK